MNLKVKKFFTKCLLYLSIAIPSTMGANALAESPIELNPIDQDLIASKGKGGGKSGGGGGKHRGGSKHRGGGGKHYRGGGKSHGGMKHSSGKYGWNKYGGGKKGGKYAGGKYKYGGKHKHGGGKHGKHRHHHHHHGHDRWNGWGGWNVWYPYGYGSWGGWNGWNGWNDGFIDYWPQQYPVYIGDPYYPPPDYPPSIEIDMKASSPYPPIYVTPTPPPPIEIDIHPTTPSIKGGGGTGTSDNGETYTSENPNSLGTDRPYELSRAERRAIIRDCQSEADLYLSKYDTESWKKGYMACMQKGINEVYAKKGV